MEGLAYKQQSLPNNLHLLIYVNNVVTLFIHIFSQIYVAPEDGKANQIQAST